MPAAMAAASGPVVRDHTTTKREGKGEVVALKGCCLETMMRTAVPALVQMALEAAVRALPAVGEGVGWRTDWMRA